MGVGALARRAWRMSWTRGCCWSPAGKEQGCGPEERKQGGVGAGAGRDTAAVRLSCPGRPPPLHPQCLLHFPQPPDTPRQNPTCLPHPHRVASSCGRQSLESSSCPLPGAWAGRLPRNESQAGDSHTPRASLILESPMPRCPESSSRPNASPPECFIKESTA